MQVEVENGTVYVRYDYVHELLAPGFSEREMDHYAGLQGVSGTWVSTGVKPSKKRVFACQDYFKLLLQGHCSLDTPQRIHHAHEAVNLFSAAPEFPSQCTKRILECLDNAGKVCHEGGLSGLSVHQAFVDSQPVLVQTLAGLDDDTVADIIRAFPTSPCPSSPSMVSENLSI